MKMTLSTSHAAGLLIDDCDAGWSYAGARALVEWLEELEEDMDGEIEFDKVALRCDYSEYETATEILEEYYDEDTIASIKSGCENEEEEEEAAVEYIERYTILIPFKGGYILERY